MNIHLSDRCWLLDSSLLWKQLKIHFLTSSQSLKCSSVFCEKEHRQPHTEENSVWGSPGDWECLRELGFRAHCSFNYFYSQGYVLAHCNGILIQLFSWEDAFLVPYWSFSGYRRLSEEREVLTLAAPGPINVSQFASLSVNENTALGGWWLYNITVVQNIQLLIREIILNICLIHVHWGTLEQTGSKHDMSMVELWQGIWETNQGREKRKHLLLSTGLAASGWAWAHWPCGSAFLMSTVKAVHSNNLPLQLGPWHFSPDFMRSCVVFLNISLCQILLH